MLVYGVLATIVLVLGVTASVILATRSGDATLNTKSLTTNNGDPLIGAAEEHHVVAVAEQFALRMDDVDGANPTAYTNGIEPMLTTKQKAEFKTEYEQVQKLTPDATLKGTGTILASGISDIDTDSATVLVAHDSTVTSSAGTTQRHYRWTISLDKVHGVWLIDDFTQVS
jgi:hypothetical protein